MGVSNGLPVGIHDIIKILLILWNTPPYTLMIVLLLDQKIRNRVTECWNTVCLNVTYVVVVKEISFPIVCYPCGKCVS